MTIDQLHSFFERLKAVLKQIQEPVTEKIKIAGLRKQKAMLAVVKKQPDNLQVSTIERSVFTAFQQDYAKSSKYLFISQATASINQQKKIRISYSSALMPLPAGTLKMLDLCKNPI